MKTFINESKLSPTILNAVSLIAENVETIKDETKTGKKIEVITAQSIADTFINGDISEQAYKVLCADMVRDCLKLGKTGHEALEQAGNLILLNAPLIPAQSKNKEGKLVDNRKAGEYDKQYQPAKNLRQAIVRQTKDTKNPLSIAFNDKKDSKGKPVRKDGKIQPDSKITKKTATIAATVKKFCKDKAEKMLDSWILFVLKNSNMDTLKEITKTVFLKHGIQLTWKVVKK